MRSTVLVLLAITIGLGAQSAPPGTTNYTRIDATVACAGATTVDAIPAIKADGFKAIINLRQASEEGANVEAAQQAATAAGLKYIHIPFNGGDPKSDAVDQFLVAVKDPANSPVFIHCASANRAGMMWLIKRVVVDGWPLEKATAEAERAGLSSPRLKTFALEYLRAHGKA
ncbi:MAG: hypothetical protein JJE40_08375 [Vicinamibacteria bacterium]|nr:hypothetical protein [Vicinamibacteria bacterium]